MTEWTSSVQRLETREIIDHHREFFYLGETANNGRYRSKGNQTGWQLSLVSIRRFGSGGPVGQVEANERSTIKEVNWRFARNDWIVAVLERVGA